jgi:hypothetical protein
VNKDGTGTGVNYKLVAICVFLEKFNSVLGAEQPSRLVRVEDPGDGAKCLLVKSSQVTRLQVSREV